MNLPIILAHHLQKNKSGFKIEKSPVVLQETFYYTHFYF